MDFAVISTDAGRPPGYGQRDIRAPWARLGRAAAIPRARRTGARGHGAPDEGRARVREAPGA